ncbi:MAG TPA: type II secretion system protein GspK [Acetobacteraceae bacterium]|nr:type II secretion system protein GspK [Acetobacteraceae bacterium]
MKATWQERSRGFALLIVLWTMVLLALLVTEITSAGRSDAELATNLRGSAVAQAAADGAEAIAIFRYLDPSALHWSADGILHRLRIGDAEVAVAMTDEDGRVNPNTASASLLVALLRRIGVDPGTAARLASAMVDWRSSSGVAPSPFAAKMLPYRAAGMTWGPPSGPFRSSAEIALLLGMTPTLLARLRPHISVFTEGDVDAVLADPVVRAALADANGGIVPPSLGSSGAARTLRITARAIADDGSRFTRTSVVSVNAANGTLATLAWRQNSP